MFTFARRCGAGHIPITWATIRDENYRRIHPQRPAVDHLYFSDGVVDGSYETEGTIMSDDSDKTPQQLEAIEKETRAFVCPNCGEHWQFRVSVQVKGIQPTPTGEEIAERDGKLSAPKKPVNANAPMDLARPALQRLKEYYRETGLLDAFEQTVSDIKAHQLPNDIGNFFLSWLKKCVVANQIPKLALRKLINEFDDGQIEVWHSDEIAAVLSNGKLRAFVPTHILRGELVRMGIASTTRLRTMATEERLDNWIRTKHGYVLGTGAMFSELQRQAKGNFELTVR